MKRRFVMYWSVLVAFAAVFAAPPVFAVIDNTPDNDSVAIIRGGVFSENEVRQKARQADVPKVFAAFGINQNELNGFVDGVVYRDGRVTVGNDKVVARNALTAGRWETPKPGMTKIPGTNNAYKMSPSDFTDEGQTAFIKMVNGKFSFAVIKPCGNPVTATPVAPPTPDITISKDVSTIQTDNWRQTVTVKPGEQVKYRVIVKNTGKVVLDKLSINENFPEGISQVASKLTLNGSNLTNNLSTDDMNLPALQPGQQHVITYEAVTNPQEKRPTACETGLTNNVIISSGGVLPNQNDTAVVKVCAPPVPTAAYSCTTLDQQYINIAERRVRFTAAHTVTGNATFKHYMFDYGDGTSEQTTESTREHRYGNDENYTARVTAVFTVNGKDQLSTTDACTKPVSFTTPQTPATPPDQPSKAVPATLVDTGAGAVIGGVFSTIVGGFVAYKYVWLRRFAL